MTKTYDETYNLTKVTDAEKQNYLYQYDDAGRVTKLTYPNGWVEDYTYDAEGNLLTTIDTDPFHNNKKSTKYEYTYDAEGNLVTEYKRDTTASNRALTTTYAYDALNRLVSAREVGVGVNTTRTYQYDTLGNLIRQEQDGCIEYKYNGYSLDETTKCGTIPNSIGTSYWEYTYDGRGNLISNDKYTRTTSGMAWQNEESYVYDETNHMVQGTNEEGEVSLYTYNGLGIRVGRELILKDNTHGYTDFHKETPSVETGLTKPEVVKESYVIDYTSATFNTLVMDEVGGFNYKWVYGLERLSVKVTSEGTNWWGQNVTTNILKDYLHQDRLGSTTNLSDTYGRVVGRADYNEWGEVTYKEALSITSSYRRIYPQLNYTGYDWDDVLGMYYAKARFYSADDKRFVAMDPIKGSVVDPLSLVSYLYCVDNPLRWVDPLGMFVYGVLAPLSDYSVAFSLGANVGVFRIWDDCGNEAVVTSGWVGFGSPNAGTTLVGFIISSANTIFDFIYGDAVDFGGSIGFFSVDYINGTDVYGNMFHSVFVGGGVSFAPVEFHVGGGFGSIIKVIKRNGVELNDGGRNLDYYEDLCCKYKQLIAQDLGLYRPQVTYSTMPEIVEPDIAEEQYFVETVIETEAHLSNNSKVSPKIKSPQELINLAPQKHTEHREDGDNIKSDQVQVNNSKQAQNMIQISTTEGRCTLIGHQDELILPIVFSE